MLGSDVSVNVGRLFADEIAIRTFEIWYSAALVLQVAISIALDGKVSIALWTLEPSVGILLRFWREEIIPRRPLLLVSCPVTSASSLTAVLDVVA